MWLLFVSIVILEIILDFANRETSECVRSNPIAGWLLIGHHITSCFLLYGWLFSNSFILLTHVLVVLGTIIYWKSNNNLCDMTIYVNEKCGWHRDKPFHDLLDMVGLKDKPMWNELGHYLFIIAGGLISFWKLLN